MKKDAEPAQLIIYQQLWKRRSTEAVSGINVSIAFFSRIKISFQMK